MGTIKRVVVKIGTTSLTGEDGTLDASKIDTFVEQLAAAKKKGIAVALVTSGAIGSGKAALGIKAKVRDVPLRQACAAIGQPLLMQYYINAFERYGIPIAQLLLTYDIFANRKAYLNLENSLRVLFERGVIPIINENDPIAVDEIETGEAGFGDNDKLSAFVASKMDADLLIILSDIDGLYDKNPKEHKNARIIRQVESITPQIAALAGKPGSVAGTGGMKTKIEAAKVCSQAGVKMIIAKASEPQVITRLLAGEGIGTLFLPAGRIEQKKRWISFARTGGSITIDEGALEAVRHGKNLLPAGVRGVEGVFAQGEVVDIQCRGACAARAIVDYSSEELRAMLADHAQHNYKGHKNVFKRENMVLILPQSVK
ncbi:glutamate 5-kinase [Candidatus Woesearchaeota archaeon]|nr:glutamate 5-kinase [Candidatus Woesearchaeota archaeon]